MRAGWPSLFHLYSICVPSLPNGALCIRAIPPQLPSHPSILSRNVPRDTLRGVHSAGPLCCLRRIPEPSCPLLYFSTLIWLTTPTQLILVFCNPSGYQCHPRHLRVWHLPCSGFPVSQLINPTTTLQLLMKSNVNLESVTFALNSLWN